jgi:hypothetical protein
MRHIPCRRVEVSNYSTNWNVHLTNSNYCCGLEVQTEKDILFALTATFSRHSGILEFVIVKLTEIEHLPINNTNFSIEKWRKAVDVINARIHRVLMVWMQLELHHAENAPTVFLSWILLQGQNGNWLVISKKYLFTVFCVWASTWMCLFYFRCQVVIKVCEDANKLSVASSTCPECDARQINVEYRPVNS